MAAVRAPSAPGHSSHGSPAACPSHQPRSRSGCPQEEQSRAQTLEHRADHGRIYITFNADPNFARKLNVNRTASLSNHSFRLSLRCLLIFSNADRQQLHRALRERPQLAVAIQAPPLKDLVRVHSILQSNSRHRSTSFKRLLHNPATLHRAPSTARASHQLTAHANINHPHIIKAQQHPVNAANTGRLRTIRNSRARRTRPFSGATRLRGFTSNQAGPEGYGAAANQEQTISR